MAACFGSMQVGQNSKSHTGHETALQPGVMKAGSWHEGHQRKSGMLTRLVISLTLSQRLNSCCEQTVSVPCGVRCVVCSVECVLRPSE